MMPWRTGGRVAERGTELATGWVVWDERTAWGSRVAYDKSVSDTVEMFPHGLKPHQSTYIPRAVMVWLLADLEPAAPGGRQ
jgi:hypothetical protein